MTLVSFEATVDEDCFCKLYMSKLLLGETTSRCNYFKENLWWKLGVSRYVVYRHLFIHLLHFLISSEGNKYNELCLSIECNKATELYSYFSGAILKFSTFIGIPILPADAVNSVLMVTTI